MNRSDTTANLASSLVKAQTALKNPHFDSTNPHFKSKFASLAAVREAVVPVFSACGIAITQWPVATENGFAGCRTRLDHVSGEWMEETFLIPVDKGNAHGYASAVTYAKRISMQSVAAVVGDEDGDGNAAVQSNPVSKITAKASLEDEYNKLDDKEKKWLNELAGSIADWVAEGKTKEAMEELDHAIPYIPRPKTKDTEYKQALQHLLPTNVMKAIKEYRQQLKEAA